MTEQVTRRAAVAGAGASVLGVLSGCTAFGAQSDESSGELPRLDQVYVSNHHPEPQTVHVLVERADEIAYWNTFEIRGLDEEENVAHGEIIEPPSFPRERADWWISARFDGETTGLRQRLQEVGPPGCYRFTIRVTADGDFMFLHDSPSCSETTTATYKL